MVQLLAMTREALAGYLKEMGLPAFRAGQVYAWMMQGPLFEDMTNPPKDLRHRLRPEVAAALQGGVGESLRLSDTQLAFMMYAAKRIAPGVILRLGYPVEIISHTLLFYSIGVVALAIILYILQRRRLTRFAVAMVRQMDDVRRLLEGATTDPTAVFPELQPALRHIA